MADDVVTTREAAEILGMARTYFARWKRKGVVVPVGKRGRSDVYSRDEIESLRDMRADGYTFRPRGSQAHCSRLTEAQVREIKRRCAAGERQHIVGRDYGLSQSQVSRIVNGHSWRHVIEEAA